jgi:sulfur carrier protein ThiS adenylyltransferase
VAEERRRECVRIHHTDDPAIRARLRECHVAIVGCGGLGSNAAMMLVRAGIGELTLMDFDVVEEDNLNRQAYFRDQIGQPKTQALAELLRRVEPSVALNLHQTVVTPDNLAELVGDADLVIEAVDCADVKADVINVVLRDMPGMPLVSASGLAGIASTNEIVTEQLADDFFMVGDMVSDVREGLPLISSRVITAAAHEAHAAIRYLIGHPEV